MIIATTSIATIMTTESYAKKPIKYISEKKVTNRDGEKITIKNTQKKVKIGKNVTTDTRWENFKVYTKKGSKTIILKWKTLYRPNQRNGFLSSG